MTMNDAARDRRQEPSEIEMLLPWYEAGTLGRRDRQRVADALKKDPALAQHVDLVREELAETIHLNETLGAPSADAVDRLMAAIDVETAARKHTSPGIFLTGFFANLTPRTLAIGASFAVLAIAVQASMLVGVLTKPVTPGEFSRLSAERHGTFAMVRFARQASAAEITNFLQNYQATLVDGPTAGGLYRVRVAMTALAKEEIGRIVARMRHEPVVESAEPEAND
jgi:anti-sigma-K factor RskA